MKSNIKPFFLIISCFLICSACFSQNENIRLFYHEKWSGRINKKPKDQKKWQEFELFSRMYARYAILEEKRLPLVFNVIDIANSNKVDEALILDQIEIINTAFKGEVANVTGRNYDDVKAGDTKLIFCIGDPNGNIKGINFREKSAAYLLNEFELISDKKEGLEGAKKDEYINIWITEMPDNMGGIAIMPNQDSLVDGIYIDPDFFGLQPQSEYYKDGKTIIHFLGQYLGLKPLWADDCMDDGIEDTPIHNGPNYKCFEYGHITLCPGNEEEMIGNFMDATPDECAFMFTKGQAARMHATLTDKGFRKQLLDGKKLCDENINHENLTESRAKITKLDFEIRPNPANTIVEVIFENPLKENSIKMEIHDLSGNKINLIDIPSIFEQKGRISIDVTNYNVGSYIITLFAGTEKISKTFIKI